MNSQFVDELKQRRRIFMDKLGDTAIAIIYAAPHCSRNADSEYPYRQNSDFHYLIGLEEPNAVAVFLPFRDEGEVLLFNESKNPQKECWTGEILGQHNARQQLAIDMAYPIDEFSEMLPKLMRGRSTLFYNFTESEKDSFIIKTMNALKPSIQKGIHCPKTVKNLSAVLDEQRLFKSDFELTCIRKAIAASVDGHKSAMRTVAPGLFEYHLNAELSYHFQKNACLYHAYTPVVAAGKNACTLHYVKNNAELKDGDLVLIDAGAEYNNYAADITRTFPINGHFSEEQKALYEVVLKSQKAAIEIAKPGIPWNAMQDVILEILVEGLVGLGILKGNIVSLIEQKAYLPFYMHSSGHWLGLDVHDAGNYKVSGNWRNLEPGMVLTVEPGLYISENIPNVDDKWKNIGIRIEDDILITTSGPEVLSNAIPKEISDIEAWMSS